MVKYKVKKKIYHDPVRGLKNGVRLSIEESLELLNSTAKAYAPVDRGILRGNIFKKMGNMIGYVIAKSDYAVFQEDGTKYMSAANGGKGFFKPAVQYLKIKLNGITGRNIRSSMKRS